MDEPALDRRAFGEGLAAFAAAITVGGFETPAFAQARRPPAHDMSKMPARWMGKEKIGFLIYPGFTALDMVGPQYMLSGLMGASTHIVAKTLEPITSDTGLIITPTKTFTDVERDLDVLCIPGGSNGTLAAMRDDATLAFVKSTGERAKYVTSVCTGSMILGAAGLLDGYKATSHWVTKPLLPIFGATPTAGRVVRDRNRITAEGVTAGVDFGLSLVAELRDREYAEGMQLLAQYAPQPPFSAGDPDKAPKAVREMVESMFAGFSANMKETARAAFEKSKSL